MKIKTVSKNLLEKQITLNFKIYKSFLFATLNSFDTISYCN